jgi:hypothetical protein
MSRKRFLFHIDRSVADLCQSAAFWHGVAAGFAPETYLLRRQPRSRAIFRNRALENLDPLEYSWTTVGSFLTGAMADCYGEEAQFAGESEAAGEHESSHEHAASRRAN